MNSSTRKISDSMAQQLSIGFLEDQKIKVIEYSVLSNLGNVSQAIFDKTDTLTTNKIEILMLATIGRVYSINTDKAEKILLEIEKNPEKFRKREELNDKLNATEAQKYSEKSQEYDAELDGDFISEVFEEDESMIKGFQTAGLKIDPGKDLKLF